MRPLVLGGLLVTFWLALTPHPGWGDVLLALAASTLVLFIARREPMRRTHRVRYRVVLILAWTFVRELVRATIRVAYDVLTPTLHARPAILAVPLDLHTDVQLTLFANLLSLTPGSISMHLAPDRKKLYVHFMFVDPDDLDASRREVKTVYERLIKELLTEK